ncbi:MAG: nucleoside 2-deoxyribosyltransferase [Sciscionella sp.]
MFYVAHRLFAAHDRALGALVARRLADEVGAGQVFLPFCDTDEEDLVAEVKGRRLFELDRQRLAGLSGLLAVLHGPSLDDGVCMELGYAAARNVPVVVLTTDFITHGLNEHGPELLFPDSLVQTVATEVVRLDKLGPRPASTANRFSVFGQRNTDQITAAVDVAVERLIDLTGALRAPATPDPSVTRVAFCEPSPYWTDESWGHITDRMHDRGYQVQVANRFSASDPIAAAVGDWAAVTSADLLITDVSGPETPPGAAMMTGACAALGRPILARQQALSWTFAHGREPNWRNLMIQYAIAARFSDGSPP